MPTREKPVMTIGSNTPQQTLMTQATLSLVALMAFQRRSILYSNSHLWPLPT